jgi:hypothetical protein
MGKVDWILGQVLFWVLVVTIVLTATVGIRRSGAILTAHQAGLVSGRAALGPAQGLVQASSDLSGWWGTDADGAGDAVELELHQSHRSIEVRVRATMGTLFGGSADLGAGSYQRWEDFYPGPPDEFE